MRWFHCVTVAAALLGAAPGVTASVDAPRSAPPHSRATATPPSSVRGRLPLHFEANRGQADERGEFLLTGTEAVFVHAGPGSGAEEHDSARSTTEAVRMRGARPAGGLDRHDALPAGLTPSDWSSIHAAYEDGRHAVFEVEGGHRARNPGQQWTTRFDGRGFTTSSDAGDWSWGLDLVSYGRSGAEHVVELPQAVTAEGGRVAYAWDGRVTARRKFPILGVDLTAGWNDNSAFYDNLKLTINLEVNFNPTDAPDNDFGGGGEGANEDDVEPENGTGGSPGDEDTIAELITTVEAAGLSETLESSLVTKLNQAQEKLDRGDTTGATKGALGSLRAFINQVEAKRDNGIDDADASEFVSAAIQLMDKL